MTTPAEQPERHLRRTDAAKYVVETYNVPCSPKTLAKLACVSSEGKHANEILSKVVNFIENNLQQGGLEDYEIEILHLD